MRILITGAAGYIGSHTCVELINAGYDIVGIDSLERSNLNTIKSIRKLTGINFPFMKGNLLNSNFIDSVFKKHRIAAVIHFAAYKSVGESTENPILYYKNNINCLNNLLDAMLKAKVKELIFSSSCTVYGLAKVLPVKESSTLEIGQNPYARTKQICEDIIIDCAKRKQIRTVILRYFNPIGAHSSALLGDNPKGRPENLMPFVSRTALGIYPFLTVFGGNYETKDGTCLRDYLHVVDLALAHLKSVEWIRESKQSVDCEIFNVGTGKGYSVLELIDAFEKANNIKIKYKIGPKRTGDLPSMYADTRKARLKLKWKAIYSLEDMVSSAWNWELQNKSHFF